MDIFDLADKMNVKLVIRRSGQLTYCYLDKTYVVKGGIAISAGEIGSSISDALKNLVFILKAYKKRRGTRLVVNMTDKRNRREYIIPKNLKWIRRG